MSFFSGGSSSSKGKDRAGRELKVKDMASGHKSQFYVEFLGWMESSGVRGRQYTDPVVQELKRRQSHLSRPPKLTIQLTQKEMKITQDLEDKPKPRSIKKIKFPAIPARDITFAVQWRRSSDKGLEDVVACIYLGYMPRTQRYVHVHVYRFDEPATASTFTRLLNDLISANTDRIAYIERELAEKGEIEDPRLGSSDGMSEGTQRTGTDSAAGSASGSGYSEEEEGEGYPPFLNEDVEEDLQSLCEVQPFDNVAEELKHRLTLKDGPLLLPPKDYDTISRARGNLMDINQRRCLSLAVAEGEGETGTTQEGGGGGTLTSDQRQRNASEESGIDLASPVSDGGDVISRFSSRSGSDSSSLVAVQSPRGSVDKGCVYPPRVDRGAAHPRAALGRQSSQSSLLSNHSSHSSQHSDSGEGAPGAGRRVHVYRRANSTSSFPALPPHPLNACPPPHLSAPISEDLLPPRDYDDDDQLFPREAVPFRSAAVPAVSPRRASSSDIPSKGSGLRHHCMPASALYAEIHRGQVGGVREEGEVVYNPERRLQPVYLSPRPW